MDVRTVAIEKRNGLIAITLVILIARTMPDSSKPGLTIYLISGSAKIIIKTLVISVNSASKFRSDVDISHADFLLPLINLSLNTGMNETASAPEVKMKNMKSGIVNAAV